MNSAVREDDPEARDAFSPTCPAACVAMASIGIHRHPSATIGNHRQPAGIPPESSDSVKVYRSDGKSSALRRRVRPKARLVAVPRAVPGSGSCGLEMHAWSIRNLSSPLRSFPSSMTADDSAFWPSEYSALIVERLMRQPGLARSRAVCDVGTGSGVLAAASLQLGASSVLAVDIDPSAVALAAQRLGKVADAPRWRVSQGSLWGGAGESETFDLVLANLPNFPTDQAALPGRPSSWSVAGVSGREALDPFLAQLPGRLRRGGSALFTQNRCVGLGQSLSRLHAARLPARIGASSLVVLGPTKVRALADDLAEPSGVRTVAGFVFLEVCLVEVGAAAMADMADSGGRA